jgi:cell division septation protein DedD
VKQIIKTGKRRYPKKHLKALLNIFSLFPMHSLVKLNSNTVGRVIQTYPDQPMRPKIEVVFDSQGRRVLARQVINLAENSILYIVDSVSEKDAKGMAPGPVVKPYPQTQAAAPHGREPAIIQDIDAMDGEASPDTDILEITEDDLEPSPPAAAREEPEPDRNRFIIRSKDGEEGKDEFIAGSGQISVPEKGRRIARYKFILLAAVIVVLSVIALWQLGLMDFLLKKSDSPGMSVKTSEKKVAKAVDKKVLKEKTQPAPPLVKGPAPSPQKQALSENPHASAAGMPADTIKALTPLAQPIIDKARAEVPAGLKPGGAAAEALKVRGGSYPFSIKLDSFRTSKEAQAALAAYSAKGLNAYWVKANLGSQGVWYRVFAGCYPTLQQAEAVIRELGLKDAVAKETKYATLIGTFSSRAAMDQKVKWLSDKGYSAYVIQDRDQTLNLFVGAFYTRKGIEEQFADLRSNDIQGQIVER